MCFFLLSNVHILTMVEFFTAPMQLLRHVTRLASVGSDWSWAEPQVNWNGVHPAHPGLAVQGSQARVCALQAGAPVLAGGGEWLALKASRCCYCCWDLEGRPRTSLKLRRVFKMTQ